jgi:hypothetical protein
MMEGVAREFQESFGIPLPQELLPEGPVVPLTAARERWKTKT